MSARFDFTYTGKQDFRSGNHHTTLAPYGIFNGNNGESIIIGALNQNLWTKLCNVMGKPELADDPKFVTNDKRCENLLSGHRRRGTPLPVPGAPFPRHGRCHQRS